MSVNSPIRPQILKIAEAYSLKSAFNRDSHELKTFQAGNRHRFVCDSFTSSHLYCEVCLQESQETLNQCIQCHALAHKQCRAHYSFSCFIDGGIQDLWNNQQVLSPSMTNEGPEYSY